MKINTQSRVAIAAILDIAVHGTTKPVSLASVGARQRVSVSYLEQLFKKMREKGLVVSQRGPGGGYQMNQGLDEVSVADVIAAVDRAIPDCDACQSDGRCEDPQCCVPKDLWSGVDDRLHGYLRSVTLDSLLDSAGETTGSPQASLAKATASYMR